ncbi:MAG: hypothetical protein ACRDKS_15200, partial [Actinomycetota bacterium]
VLEDDPGLGEVGHVAHPLAQDLLGVVRHVVYRRRLPPRRLRPLGGGRALVRICGRGLPAGASAVVWLTGPAPAVAAAGSGRPPVASRVRICWYRGSRSLSYARIGDATKMLE